MHTHQIRLSTLLIGCFLAIGCGDPTDAEGEPELPSQYMAGRTTYDAKCASCHDSSRDGAPRLGYQPAWSRRLEQGESVLIEHATNGYEMMPPRGDNEDLTDDAVAEAVKYMIYQAGLNIPAGG